MKIKRILLLVENYLLPIFLLFAITIICLEFLTHTNFILETLHIDYVDTFIIASFLYLVSKIRNGTAFFRKHWQTAIFLLPLFLTAIFMIVFMRHHSFYLFIEKEDSLIEWGQFLFIALSSIFSFLLYRKWYQKHTILGILFFLAAIGFFVIAGEEISWGQRIFNIQTPEEFAKMNSQGEITLHNYGPVFGYVYRAYALLGFIGAAAWTVKRAITKQLATEYKKITEVLIPSWYFFFYFFTTFAYNLYFHILFPRTGGNTGDDLFEEPIELLLFFGVALFLFTLLLSVYSKSKQRKQRAK